MYSETIRNEVATKLDSLGAYPLRPCNPDVLVPKTIKYSLTKLPKTFPGVLCYPKADSRGVESPWVTFEQAKALAAYHNSVFDETTVDYDEGHDVWRCGEKDDDRLADYCRGVDVEGIGHVYPWCWNTATFVEAK